MELRAIGRELREHVPFTAFGAVTGIVLMVIVVLARVPAGISQTAFFTMHPLHVVFSAVVTTAMYRKYGSRRLIPAVLVGYFGSVGLATLSDAFIPYWGGVLLHAKMELEIPVIEEWWLVNPAALVGIAIGYLRPATKLPHFGHVLLSTWASLFYFTAFGVAYWLPLLPFIFLFLFLAVWLPCCVSDIVFPIFFTGGRLPHHHS